MTKPSRRPSHRPAWLPSHTGRRDLRHPDPRPRHRHDDRDASVVRAVLLQRLPVRNQERVAVMWTFQTPGVEFRRHERRPQGVARGGSARPPDRRRGALGLGAVCRWSTSSSDRSCSDVRSSPATISTSSASGDFSVTCCTPTTIASRHPVLVLGIAACTRKSSAAIGPRRRPAPGRAVRADEHHGCGRGTARLDWTKTNSGCR